GVGNVNSALLIHGQPGRIARGKGPLVGSGNNFVLLLPVVKAAEGCRSPRRWRVFLRAAAGEAFGLCRQSAAATALWISSRGLWKSPRACLPRPKNPKQHGAPLPGEVFKIPTTSNADFSRNLHSPRSFLDHGVSHSAAR